MFNRKKKSGMTLIETAIAVGLAAVFMAASIALVIQAQALANSAALKNQSTKYADQLREKVIGFKKNNTWALLYAGVGSNYKDLVITPPSLVGSSATACPASGNPTSSPSVTQIGTTGFWQCFKLVSISGETRVMRVDVFIYYSDRGNWLNNQVSFFISDT